MHLRHKPPAAAAAVIGLTVASLLLAGCAADGGPQPTGDPIVVGSINAISGALQLAESSQAAAAVFDQYNADGGLNGRPIQYVMLDDKGDPSTSSAAARDVVGQQGAVAMVGSASLIDCEVNHAYYAEEGIISIQGTGADSFCFSTPDISPINGGPYLGATLMLNYGTAELGLESICGVLLVGGSVREAYQAAFDAWTDATGADFTMLDDTAPYGASDWTPYVVKVKEAGCDALFTNAPEADAVGLMKAAEAQGLNNLTYLTLTGVYTQAFAQTTTFDGNGLYTLAEFAPYIDVENEDTNDWRTLMESKGIPLTSFGQGGYIAAKHFIEVLESIEGDITRESVTAAFKGMTEGLESSMTGTPWIFGPGKSHNSNTSGWPLKLDTTAGSWADAAGGWTTLADYE